MVHSTVFQVFVSCICGLQFGISSFLYASTYVSQFSISSVDLTLFCLGTVFINMQLKKLIHCILLCVVSIDVAAYNCFCNGSYNRINCQNRKHFEQNTER